MGHKSILMAMNDAWYHGVLYAVADYSGMDSNVH